MALFLWCKMKIKSKNGKLQLISLWKPMIMGHVISMAILGLPLGAALVIGMIITGAVEPVNFLDTLGAIVGISLLLVFSVLLQGIMFTGSALFGLTLYKLRSELEIEESNE